MKIWLFVLLLFLVGCAAAEESTPLEEPIAFITEPALIGKETVKQTNIDKPRKRPPAPTQIAYITIDDGPTRDVTPQILDTLRDHDVKATFFILPKKDVDDLYERIRREGHTVGNHSESHDYNRLYGDETFFREDLARAAAFIEEKFGEHATLFRFPGGSMGWPSAAIARRKEILEELGYTYFDWDASNGDTAPGPESRDPTVLTANVMAKADGHNQLVILMHDSAGKTPTAESLPQIIEQLKTAEYAFDTLDHYERNERRLNATEV